MDVIYDTVAVAITAPLLNCTHHSCIEDQIFAVNGETIHKTLGWRTANHLMYRSVRDTPTTNIEPENHSFFVWKGTNIFQTSMFGFRAVLVFGGGYFSGKTCLEPTSI